VRKEEWLIYRSCVDKKSFSKEEADTLVDDFARNGKVIYWYKCELCMRYHITRKDQNEIVKKLEIR